jgi:hypothetical protein
VNKITVKETKYEWSARCQEAFDLLKSKFTDVEQAYRN